MNSEKKVKLLIACIVWSLSYNCDRRPEEVKQKLRNMLFKVSRTYLFFTKFEWKLSSGDMETLNYYYRTIRNLDKTDSFMSPDARIELCMNNNIMMQFSDVHKADFAVSINTITQDYYIVKIRYR